MTYTTGQRVRVIDAANLPCVRLPPLTPERIAELQHRESCMERWEGHMPDDTKGAE